MALSNTIKITISQIFKKDIGKNPKIGTIKKFHKRYPTAPHISVGKTKKAKTIIENKKISRNTTKIIAANSRNPFISQNLLFGNY